MKAAIVLSGFQMYSYYNWVSGLFWWRKYFRLFQRDQVQVKGNHRASVKLLLKPIVLLKLHWKSQDSKDYPECCVVFPKWRSYMCSFLLLIETHEPRTVWRHGVSYEKHIFKNIFVFSAIIYQANRMTVSEAPELCNFRLTV